jgi:hypothetical protein
MKNMEAKRNFLTRLDALGVIRSAWEMCNFQVAILGL